MSLSYDNNGNGLVMPVSPMNYGGNGGFLGGDGAWWLIVLLLIGWGGNGFGNGFGGGGAVNVGNDVQRGFDQSAVMNGLSGINSAITAGFAGAEAADSARQIANLQQAFATQTAITGGINTLASQLANCCCENRLATANLNSTILAENCADRAAISDALKDVVVNQNANTQRILDMMCQDKIDAKNDEISALRQQVAMKDIAASQTAQNAFIQQGFTNEVDQLYNRLSNCPVPSTPVYGRTPIFTCNGNNGCGCGCGNGAF